MDIFNKIKDNIKKIDVKFKKYKDLARKIDSQHPYYKLIIFFTSVFLYFNFSILINGYNTYTKAAILEAKYENVLNKYKSDSIRLNQLKNSDDALEKVAREKYLMKQEDETIFLIKEVGDE